MRPCGSFQRYASAREATLAYRIHAPRETFVPEEDKTTLCTYTIGPNHPGGGAHVANCGYMTAPAATGQGIAKAMCAHSLDHARAGGFTAMQFNFVVCANQRAVRLWHHLGFETVGHLPAAFAHPRLGFVDALVLFPAL